MNMHGRIMNIPTPEAARAWPNYGVGYRDARHAAAEIANNGDALIAELVDVVKLLLDVLEPMESLPETQRARAAIAKAKALGRAIPERTS